VNDEAYEFVSGCGMAIVTGLLMFPAALAFQWAWGLFAAQYGLPPIEYWPAFGLLLASRLLLPYRVIAVRRSA
jgi:hypothetical protein